jgi:hypothetical protein
MAAQKTSKEENETLDDLERMMMAAGIASR